MIVPTNLECLLNDKQRDAMRRLARWNFSSDDLLVDVHPAVAKKLRRVGLVREGTMILTDAGIIAAALLDEIDQLQRSRKET